MKDLKKEEIYKFHAEEIAEEIKQLVKQATLEKKYWNYWRSYEKNCSFEKIFCNCKLSK